MPFETIIKPPAGALPVTPNLSNYEGQRSTFSWDELAKELDGLPGGGLNIAYEALDRHVAKGNGDKPAILWEGKTGDQETYTFADMARLPTSGATSCAASASRRATASSSSSTASRSCTRPFSGR
jgi:acetyl-CoA synthetase